MLSLVAAGRGVSLVPASNSRTAVREVPAALPILATIRGLDRDSGAGPSHMIPCQTVGWPLFAPVNRRAGGGKSGLHGSTVPGNARRGRP